ncbi:dual specificity protein phosphatase family protein, partial [Dehalococcoidia bacterium]|nr:dual specificity protein phosphatase family protein [Dehalococcoidia bacterium]
LIDGEIAGHSAPSSDSDLNYLKSKGVKALVRMAESHRARVTPAQVKKLGFMDCHEPVPDFTAPGKAQVDRMVAFIKQSVAEGKPVAVSCGAGIGRTGTVLTCYVVSKCYTAEQAMEEGRHKRGAEIETDDQRKAVRSYARHLGKK